MWRQFSASGLCQDPKKIRDPGSKIWDLDGSWIKQFRFCCGILGILDPTCSFCREILMDPGSCFFTLPRDPGDLGSCIFTFSGDPGDLGSWWFVLAWDPGDLGSRIFDAAWSLGSQLLADAQVYLQMHKSVLCAIFVHYLVFIEHVFYHFVQCLLQHTTRANK